MQLKFLYGQASMSVNVRMSGSVTLCVCLPQQRWTGRTGIWAIPGGLQPLGKKWATGLDKILFIFSVKQHINE